jgi:hypothetical protein
MSLGPCGGQPHGSSGRQRCYRLSPSRPRHAPEILQDITECLRVQPHDYRCVGQSNTRFGNLPS